MQGLKNSIVKGFDIVELDVKMTKDSVLVVMHDDKIDRTTNGKGKVADFTLEELKKWRLKNGLGRVTSHQIPTFKEMMIIAKDKVIINVDKGDDYLPAVFAILKQTATLKQTIVNFSENTIYQQLSQAQQIPAEVKLMAVVNMKNIDALSKIDSYKSDKQIIVQPIFATDTLTNLEKLPLIAQHQVLWLNSLWTSLNGGHEDDVAVEGQKPKESWGWLIDKKAKIIQTDRPVELLEYLKKNKLHP